MKIVIDGFNLALEKGTGVATYGRNLAYSLRGMEHEVHVLYGVRGAAGNSSLMNEIAFFDEPTSVRPERFQRARRLIGALNPFPRPIHPITLSGTVIYKQLLSRLPYFDQLWNAPHLFEQAALYFALYRRCMSVAAPGGTDIVHWTYPLPLKAPGAANIYTLHDLVPLRLPFTTLDKKRSYFKLVTHLAKQADHIVTVSETSKKDIVNILGIPESKVTNTYQTAAIPEAYLSLPLDTLQAELFGTFRLPFKNYLLFYGSIEPKKNVGRIIEAYLASNVECPLVIVGAQAWKAEQELRLLKNMPPAIQQAGGGSAGSQSERKIIYLDYVTFPQLVNLIRGALAIVFPSLYEGFGLPILEGMVCGTPVITSNLGSMVEVADDAAVLIDPYNTRDIKDAMIAITSNAELRAEKVSRGSVVARRFSPEAYQKRLQEVYSAVRNTSQTARF